MEADLTQEQRLQRILYPDGVTFLNGESRTAATSLLFKQMAEFEDEFSSLASPTGFEPVLSP